jgi:hypothetical protein
MVIGPWDLVGLAVPEVWVGGEACDGEHGVTLTRADAAPGPVEKPSVVVKYAKAATRKTLPFVGGGPTDCFVRKAVSPRL